MKNMKIGKIPAEILKRSVLSNIQHYRPEVLVRPGIGEDCAVIDFGEYICVMSTDPITGAVKDIGSLAVHVSCNDIASNGVEPLGIMFTILAPPHMTEEDLNYVMQEANKAALSINVEIIGGHTEITDAVNRMVINATAIGRKLKNGMVTSKGAQIGDAVIMTKHAGLEGASIIAKDMEKVLKGKLEEELLYEAMKFSEKISVVPEGVIAGDIGVNSMHDVTEGGIFGALWELAEASNLGVEVEEEKIPLRKETVKICQIFNLNPYKLISSGVMLMTVSQEKKSSLLKALREKGIEATEIGRMVEKERMIIRGKEKLSLHEPDTDELYKVIS